MDEDLRYRAGAQRRHGGLELGRRGARPKRRSCGTEIDGEPSDGCHNPRARRAFGRAFQRTLNDGLHGKPDAVRRIRDRRDRRTCIGIEPLESRILGGHLCHQKQRGKNHDPLPPTVTTELGVPNSSSFAAGAPGSARHSTPFTRKA